MEKAAVIHIDTNFLIVCARHGSPQQAQMQAWLAQGEQIRISVIAWAEFHCGPVNTNELAAAQLMFPNPVPLLARHALMGAQLYNRIGRRKHALNDCLIAATAIDHGARLATLNTSHFQQFASSGLQLA